MTTNIVNKYLNHLRLNEVSKGSDDSSGPITPTSKSIRDRIESKLKKRQIEEKEKKKKNKRRESIEVDKVCLFR